MDGWVRALTQYVEVLQWRAAGGQLVQIRVADGAVGSEEEFAQAGQAAGEVLETPGVALQRGTPAQVQLLQHPERARSKQMEQEGDWVSHALPEAKCWVAPDESRND